MDIQSHLMWTTLTFVNFSLLLFPFSLFQEIYVWVVGRIAVHLPQTLKTSSACPVLQNINSQSIHSFQTHNHPTTKKMVKMQNSHNLVIFQPTLSISHNQKVRILLRRLQFFKWMMDGHEGQDILFGVKLSNITSKLSASFHSWANESFVTCNSLLSKNINLTLFSMTLINFLWILIIGVNL